MTGERPQKLWFWRRSLAAMIDGVCAALIFTAVFAAIFGSASDQVRLAGLGVTTTSCSTTRPSPEVLTEASRIAPGIDWTHARTCLIGSFGLVENRVAVMSRVEGLPGGGTLTRSATIPVDASGRPVSPFYADWIGLLFVAGFAVAFLVSTMQATPGLRLMGLRLEKADGTRPPFLTVILRELCLLAAPLLAILVVPGMALLGFSVGWGFGVVLVAFILGLLIAGLWWRPFVIMRSWPKAPVHDVLTGTRMVRIGA